MKTHVGNEGKVLADIGKITFDTLDKFQIHYDEIYFGKPYADFYIDDKAINALSDVEQYLGCYQHISPRSFNSCKPTVLNTIQTITKSSKYSLNGEIYFYNNIPHEIHDMFPIFFNCVNEYTYEIEYIKGVTMSRIYTNQMDDHSKYIYEVCTSISRIHKSKSNEQFDLQLKDNYTYQLKTRFLKYKDLYDSFGNNMKTMQEYILQYFAKNTIFEECVIHGDPVFTNIIINKFGKFKFIDMRGKINSICTIRGDKHYDYGKIYQSILGYDFIINDCNFNYNIIEKAEIIFKHHLSSNNINFNHVQHITLCLLLTMLPFHTDNIEHVHKYVILANKLYSSLIV